MARPTAFRPRSYTLKYFLRKTSPIRRAASAIWNPGEERTAKRTDDPDRAERRGDVETHEGGDARALGVEDVVGALERGQEARYSNLCRQLSDVVPM